MPPQKKPLIGVLLFAGVFLYLGWQVVRQETGALRGGRASQNWPSVDGKIISSSIRTSSSSGAGRSRYYPVVEYEYSVDGKSLRGDRISFDTQPVSHQSATVITKRYSVGRVVPVFYDPEDASKCVLEPGTSRISWLGIGLGIVFALVAGRMLVTRLKRSES